MKQRYAAKHGKKDTRYFLQRAKLSNTSSLNEIHFHRNKTRLNSQSYQEICRR